MFVVVLYVDADRAFEMAAAEDQKPVEATHVLADAERDGATVDRSRSGSFRSTKPNSPRSSVDRAAVFYTASWAGLVVWALVCRPLLETRQSPPTST